MNKLIVPPAPNWFESSIIACASDNTIVYGARNEIVIIHPKPPNEVADMKIISRSHTDRINSVAINPNWGNPDKLIVSTGDDKLVRLWDAECCILKLTHKAHTTRSDKVVGAAFAGSDRVVSVGEDGTLMIWRLVSNEVTSINPLIGRDKIACISICPHASWLIACGTRKGIIIVIDLRKTGTVWHRLKGHDNSTISSLSWCPTPFNVFRTNQESDNKNVIVKSKNKNRVEKTDLPECAYEENDKEDLSLGVPLETIGVEHEENVKSNQEPPDQIAVETETNEKDLIRESNNQIASHEERLAETCDKSQNANFEISSSNMTNTSELKQKTASVYEEENIDELQDTKSKTLSKPDANPLQIIYFSNSPSEHNEEIFPVESHITTSNDESVAINNAFESSSSKSVDNLLVKEFLLASVSRLGKSFIIWRVYKGIKQTEIRLQSKPRSQNSTSCWISLCWFKPKSLLVSSYKGELFQYNLVGSSKEKFIVHNSHNSIIFNIVSPIRKYEHPDDEDWRDRNLLNVWTIGKDRFILNTSLAASREVLALYSTFAGGISCLMSSPVDPTRIAIASGDGSCRLWDLSRPHTQYIMITSLWQKSQTKIVSVAWHPTNETCLAIATQEGKVGLIETGNSSKLPIFLIQHEGTGIFSLQWGPLNGDVENFALYCVVDGTVIMYDVKKPLTEPKVIDICSKEHVSRISWKPDNNMCAIGTQKGAICFMSASFDLLKTVFIQNNIKSMAWHPEATAENTSVSTCANWLAVANETVTIYDTSLLFASEEENEYIVAEFLDHSSAVYSLAWSPHVEGRLASASCDGSALVWDVKTKTLLYCCQEKHLSNFLAVLWSPLDPDYLITGSRDSIIKIWKLSENLPQETSESKAKPKAKKNKIAKSLTIKDETNETKSDINESVESHNKNPKTHQKYALSTLAHIQNKDLLYGLNLCKQVYEARNGINNDQEDSEEVQIASFYCGSKEDVTKLLQLEKTANSQSKIKNANCYISLWQGDIANYVKEAIATKTLDPSIINMAPMISHGLWQEACEAYAKQLSEYANCNHMEISTYYLVCHKIEEAIKVLCKGSFFREALALAKCRLLPNDPLITQILEQWVERCSRTGAIEIAVQCYLALGQLNEAARLLFKRSSEEALEFCAKLATECDNKDLVDAVSLRLRHLKTDRKEETQPHLLTRAELELAIYVQNINENIVPEINQDNNDNKSVLDLVTMNDENTGGCKEASTSQDN